MTRSPIAKAIGYARAVMNTVPEILPCTEVHPLPDGEVRLLGAVRQVTGAMTRVDAGRRRILVDCGVAQGHDHMRFPEAARDAEGLVLTHGHLDHIGNVPTLLDGGWDGPIYGTAATLEIARLSLEDSLEMARLSSREIEQLLGRFRQLSRTVPYGQRVELLGSSQLHLTLHEAGHILGSASAEIVSDKSRVIVSGDLGRPDSPILRDPNTEWAAGRPVDLVVLESTYGSREHAHSHDDIQHELESILKDAIARKAKVLVPAFAIGRTQTLLYFLDSLVEANRIPDVPVMIDTPMGQAVTETYKRFRRLFDKESLAKLARGDDPLDFEDLFAVKRGRDSRRLHEVDGPMVIIAGSGMCTGGRIVGHLREGLPSPDTTVLFVGYQAEGTPGRRIQEAAKRGGRVHIDGEDVVVRARIATLRGLSAHADRKELRAWLRKIPDVRRVALHHGDVEAQTAFATWARTA
ncbi:MAG: Metallo-beta-lactamase family protein RNA-specific [Labilithrix sp.]|nr:Metallo-beta-lactamase family protein RNA-specific [Labilithrix sp.]